MTTIPVTLTDGHTHLSAEAYTRVQAVLACVQDIYADESWTVQVLAAAVIAEHQLRQGFGPDIVLQTLCDGLQNRMLPSR